MPIIISYQRYLLESMKRAIKWILIPENVMNLSWGTVKFKLDKKDFLLTFIFFRKCRYHIVSSYVKYRNNFPTEEHVVLSYAFNIVDFITVKDLKSKSAVCYVLDTLVLDPVSLLRRVF